MAEEQEPKNDRGRFITLSLLLITTVFSAVLAGLQSDASIRADEANLQSQYYAVLASAEIFREGQQSAYDIETISTYLSNTQETTVLQYSALELENKGDTTGTARLQVQALSTNARAEAAKKLSLIFADPRFAPTEPNGFPNLQAYMSESVKKANSLVAKQNAAADEYHKWDDKGDGYLTILTLLALVFFLLGVAQNSRKLRVFFIIAALVILVTSGIWTFWVLIS
jgi:hypothetical protein